MNQTIDNPAIPILAPPALPPTGYGDLTDLTAVMKERVNGCSGGSIANINVHDLYLPHFSLRKIDAQLSRDAVVYNAESPDLNNVGFGLFFKGHFKMVRKRGKELAETTRGEQNFLFDPQAEACTILNAGTTLSAVLVVVDPSYFDSVLPAERWSDDLRLKLAKKELIFANSHARITADQQRALQAVFENPIDGPMRIQMQEACLLQVLLNHLHLTFRQSGDVPVKTNRRDRDIMLAVREYLTENFTSDNSLPALAMQFGINQSKLTTVFKQMFGVTVFDYLSDLKMDHAKKLLEKDGLRVKEVAATLAYKNPHHFSAAFKRRFGFGPSDVR